MFKQQRRLFAMGVAFGFAGTFMRLSQILPAELRAVSSWAVLLSTAVMAAVVYRWVDRETLGPGVRALARSWSLAAFVILLSAPALLQMEPLFGLTWELTAFLFGASVMIPMLRRGGDLTAPSRSAWLPALAGLAALIHAILWAREIGGGTWVFLAITMIASLFGTLANPERSVRGASGTIVA